MPDLRDTEIWDFEEARMRRNGDLLRYAEALGISIEEAAQRVNAQWKRLKGRLR